jgi:hypothetical protein
MQNETKDDIVICSGCGIERMRWEFKIVDSHGNAHYVCSPECLSIKARNIYLDTIKNQKPEIPAPVGG